MFRKWLSNRYSLVNTKIKRYAFTSDEPNIAIECTKTTLCNQVLPNRFEFQRKSPGIIWNHLGMRLKF